MTIAGEDHNRGQAKTDDRGQAKSNDNNRGQEKSNFFVPKCGFLVPVVLYIVIGMWI